MYARMFASSFDSPTIKESHHFLPGIGKTALSSGDEMAVNVGRPGTVSPSTTGSNGTPMGTFCHKSSCGTLRSAWMRSSGDFAESPNASTSFSYDASANSKGIGANNRTAPPVDKHRFIKGCSEHKSIVTDTTIVSADSNWTAIVRTPASAFADSCNLIWVSTKATYVLSDPTQSCTLIMKSVVSFETSIT
jgi:hypothetical protein